MMYEWYDQVQRDLRLAGRRASRHATFTAVVIACLAVGIAAAASALSVVDAVLLRPLPFHEPDRLVQIAAFNVDRIDESERYFVSWMPVDVLTRERSVLEGVAAFYQRELDVLEGGEPERIGGAETVPGSFAVLGVRPLLGRTFSRDDVRAGRRVALISEALWTRRYGRDPSVVGRSVLVGEEPHEIVGVLPGTFRFTARTELFVLHHPDDYSDGEKLSLGVFLVIGRLPDGATIETAAADLDLLKRALLRDEPVFFRDFDFDMRSLRDFLVGDFERPLWTLLAAAGLVLLLALVNVANLLMARAQGEAHGRDVRRALGARCRRIAQHGLVENALLAGLAALLGVSLAWLGVRTLVGAATLNSPLFDDVGLSVPVLLASLACAGAAMGILSVLPAAGCCSPAELLGESRHQTSGRRRRTVQTAFVVGQVAVSFVLLVGAGLTWRTARNLAATDLGFDTERLLIVRVAAPRSRARTVETRAQFTTDVLEGLRRLPGVSAAGATSWVPFEDADVGFNYSVQDHPPESTAERALASGRIVSPGYFESMGVPLLSGRDFDRRDRSDAPPVAVVSRSFEERYWPAGSALGRRVKRGAYHLDRAWLEIVGVVDDIRSGSVSDSIRPAVFYPQAQSDGAFLSEMAYTVRVAVGEPERLLPSVRAAIREVAPTATIYRESTGAEIVRVALGRARFHRLVIGLFAVTGLVLATAGVFGVTSYAVGRRTREFGLRLALGAGPRQVRTLVLRRALALAATGIAVGAIASVVATAGLGDLLYGIESTDAVTYAAVAALLAAAVLAAASQPARRATRVDPTTALNGD